MFSSYPQNGSPRGTFSHSAKKTQQHHSQGLLWGAFFTEVDAQCPLTRAEEGRTTDTSS